MVQPPKEPEAVPVGLDIPLADWQQTPPSVKTLVIGLLKRLEALEARLNQEATTSHRPPSAESPYKRDGSPPGEHLRVRLEDNLGTRGSGSGSWCRPTHRSSCRPSVPVGTPHY